MNRWWFLFAQWFKRDVAGRYRGLWLGLLWPVAQPMAQLAVFTLIFHGFMQIHWPDAASIRPTSPSSAMASIATASTQGKQQAAWYYAMNVLAGLAVFNFFAEVLGRAPSTILSQPTLVTKLRFPLMLLPMVTLASAMIHILVASLLLVICAMLSGQASLTMLWFLLWVWPVMFYGGAIALLLSSLGVYARDISQIVPAFTSLLMFLTPIFYPLAAVPEGLRSYFALNPVAWAAESLRSLLLHQQHLDLSDWSMHVGLSLALFAGGYFCFARLRKGFADVL